jgi:hypothetical protein
MMRKLSKPIVAVCFVYALFSCGCENKKTTEKELEIDNTELPGTEDIYSFLNVVFVTSDTFCNKLLDRDINQFRFSAADSIKLVRMDSLFSKEDIAYLYRQMEHISSFRFDEKRLNIDVISGDEVMQLQIKHDRMEDFWTVFRNRYGEHCCIVSASKPLFSLDKSVVIFRREQSCGFNNFQASTIIYKKRKGRWKKVLTLSSSVS